MNFRENITLENPRVCLSPLQMEHFEQLVCISNESPELLQFSPSPFGSPELLKEYMEIAIQGRKEEKRYPFIIFDKLKNQIVGSTSFGNLSKKDARIEIGWTWIEKGVQGSGLNKECKFLLLTYAFEELSIDRVEFKIDSRNRASRRAVEKIGGTYEGMLRSHTLMRDGYRRDTVYYSILRGEWKGIKKEIFGLG